MNHAPGRIVAIDLLRGFALLGILIMNISSFALPTGSYYNPLSFEPTLLNKVVHGLSHLFADQKFMAIFSMLFGASMILLMEKTESAGRKFGRLHYARTGWLLFFGLLHFIFLWEGDILLLYAFCGLFLFLLRRIPGKVAVVIGLLIFLAPISWETSLLNDFARMEEGGRAAVEKWWAPPADEIETDIDIYRGDYGGQVSKRLEEFGDSPTEDEAGQKPAILLALEALCRALGMMIAGMGLYRLGFLTGGLSAAFYRRFLVLGLPLGLLIAGYGLWQYHVEGYDFVWALSLGRAPNHLATLLVAGAYVSLVMLWSRSDLFTGLQSRMSAVGRMAFSNYIGQTLLATLVFHGWGLGAYARFNRLEILFVVVAIWIVQIMFSSWWLERFRFGPLEWMWRCLSYMKWQPMRKNGRTQTT